MVRAGAPGAPLGLSNLSATAQDLGADGALSVAALAAALSLTLQPLQFRFVQLLEGYWPLHWFGWAWRAGVWWQRRRLMRASADIVVLPDPGRSPSQQRVLEERAQAAESTARTRFPSEDRLLPTALGNVLRAAEDRHGQRYGLESVVVWPRLFPLLPPEYAQTIEDEVTQLDVSARLVLTWATAAAAR